MHSCVVVWEGAAVTPIPYKFVKNVEAVQQAAGITHKTGLSVFLTETWLVGILPPFETFVKAPF